MEMAPKFIGKLNLFKKIEFSIIVAMVLWFLMTVFNDLAVLKLKPSTLLKYECSENNTIIKRQIIVWSRVRSGSSFFSQLLRGKNFFYSPEPIATLWPTFWEHIDSTAQTVNASTIVRFLQDVLLCKFEKYPEYVRNFYPQRGYDDNPLMTTFCDGQRGELCRNLELVYTLCKSANVHVMKVVRVHLRNLLYILRQQLDHQELSHQYNGKYYSTPALRHNLSNYQNVYYNANSFQKNAADRKKKGTKTENSSKHQLSVNENAQEVLLSKDLTWSFLKNEKLKNIKVIHLVRDPRGTINSRRRNRWILPLEKSSRSLCNDLNDELHYAMELQRVFPHRYRLIRYEWLVLDIEKTSRELYSWLGIPYTIHVAAFIAFHTLGLEKGAAAIHPFSTYRNSSANAFKWREMLDFKEMQKIQNDCKDVLKQLGYRIYHNQEDYHNPKLLPLLNTSFLD
ncbi:hypothetical protein SK128_006569 [Halocaridina rubra]|uniref:Uncharacterized protein n=1 Tax=Halocaridina rubra TaxID=373956 RepID=A0AAN8ZX85_HALRR